MRVVDLVDDKGQWRESLVRLFFPPREANQILAIYIPQYGGEDQLIWELQPNGFYSVKTGYHLASRIRRGQMPSTFF